MVTTIAVLITAVAFFFLGARYEKKAIAKILESGDHVKDSARRAAIVALKVEARVARYLKGVESAVRGRY